MIREEYENLQVTSAHLQRLIGANIGFSTYWLATEFPKAKILALEPDFENAQLAKNNISTCNNVTVLRAAIAASQCKLDLVDVKLGPDAYQTLINENGEIKGYSVRSLLEIASCEASELLIVKIDIEGFESNLFSSNTEWIAHANAIIVEPHDWIMPGKANSSNLLMELSKFSRDFLIDGENIISIKIPEHQKNS